MTTKNTVQKIFCKVKRKLRESLEEVEDIARII